MDSSEKLRVVEREFSTLAEALDKVKGQGISYEWKIPHCLRRLRYLSLLSEPGLWLDSDRFYLGGLGPLEMRLYAKGLRGGDGQCSLALRLPAEAAAKFALPMMVDLTVAGRTLRAGQTTDPEGSDCVIWLAESLGVLESHLVDELTELSLVAELPLLPAPAMLASRTTLSPPGTRDDLRLLDMASEEALGSTATLPPAAAVAAVAPVSRSRDLRGVPIHSNETAPSLASLPTLLGQTEQPSGVFALRSSWGSSCALPVTKVHWSQHVSKYFSNLVMTKCHAQASNLFEEQVSPLGSLLGHGQRTPCSIDGSVLQPAGGSFAMARNPVAIPADDASMAEKAAALLCSDSCGPGPGFPPEEAPLSCDLPGTCLQQHRRKDLLVQARAHGAHGPVRGPPEVDMAEEPAFLDSIMEGMKTSARVLGGLAFVLVALLGPVAPSSVKAEEVEAVAVAEDPAAKRKEEMERKRAELKAKREEEEQRRKEIAEKKQAEQQKAREEAEAKRAEAEAKKKAEAEA
ncbi:unnamed protein product, partial [Symbiodinium pilosum]